MFFFFQNLCVTNGFDLCAVLVFLSLHDHGHGNACAMCVWKKSTIIKLTSKKGKNKQIILSFGSHSVKL